MSYSVMVLSELPAARTDDSLLLNVTDVACSPELVVAEALNLSEASGAVRVSSQTSTVSDAVAKTGCQRWCEMAWNALLPLNVRSGPAALSPRTSHSLTVRSTPHESNLDEPLATGDSSSLSPSSSSSSSSFP